MDCRSDNVWILIGGKFFNGLLDSSYYGNFLFYVGFG